MSSKLMVATSATTQKSRYKAEFNVLSEADRIFDAAFTEVTRNMHSFPRRLLHLPRMYGGLGILKFSSTVELGKLQKLFA